MSVVSDQPSNSYRHNNLYFHRPDFGDFTPFYIAITICTVIGVSLFVLNIVLGCCSRHSRYWNDRHTGNRWLVSLWTATPHNQPPLDLTELKDVYIPITVHHSEVPPVEYLELQKKESDI